MVDSTSPESPLEAAAGAAGPRATEAFSILGNETRLSILLALWEAYDPFAEDNAVPFSELRDRIGMPDSGQFNYHLDKLAGHFIRNSDGGYELQRPGLKLVQTVIAGTGIEEPSLEPTDIGGECFRCGAPTEVAYKDGTVYLTCTECEGLWEGSETAPHGMLASGDFDPAGLLDRSPEQVWNAMLKMMKRQALLGIEGVCTVCSGPMETTLSICDDHASEGVCDNCGREWALTARNHCPVCKSTERGPPFWIVAMHPAVVGFFYQRGVPLQYESDGINLADVSVQRLISQDPPRVEVSFEYDGDRLELLLDEEMNVLEVTPAETRS